MAHGSGGHAGHGEDGQAPEHHGCTCIGCFHPGTPGPLPDADALAVRPATVSHAAAPAWRGEATLPSSPSFLLPYSTAPPVAA